jgi:alkylation response protein AidB-like acyl-CoA dehydrogenase
MDLELSEDQTDLRDNIRSVLEGICPPAAVRASYEATADASDLWKQMVDLYWPILGIPEEFGGVGLGFVEIGLLAEELGRAAAPGPLLATTSQFVPLLVELGAGEHLAEVANDGISGGLAFAERNRWEVSAVTTAATRSPDGWSITGDKSGVLSATAVDRLAVIARDEATAEVGVFLVDADAVKLAPLRSLDPGLGLADISFDGVPAEMIGTPGAQTEAALGKALQQSVVAMSLQTVGASRRIFELTLEYAKVREQYDRVIGSFQALKHRFAEMFLAVERANAVCYYAAVAIAEDDSRRVEATHLAKASAGDCQRLLAEDGLQLHGGIGYTWENDLHFLLKRAKAGELLCGSTAFHRGRLANLLGLIEEVAA